MSVALAMPKAAQSSGMVAIIRSRLSAISGSNMYTMHTMYKASTAAMTPEENRLPFSSLRNRVVLIVRFLPCRRIP